MEKTMNMRLRSEAIYNGRTQKAGHMEFARPGLKKLIEKVGEKVGQRVPAEWSAKAIVPKKWGPADPIWKK
jgi:hydroxymethylglutaryl-CoA lyase